MPDHPPGHRPVTRDSRLVKFLRSFSRGINDERQRQILLAQLFSCVAIGFITAYALAALMAGNTLFAQVLLVFISLTILNYLYLALTRRADVANLIIILLMGAVAFVRG